MPEIKDRTNIRYGRLVALRIAGKQGRNYMWLCKCDCNEETIVNGCHLATGKIRSCGCLKREESQARLTKHGDSGIDRTPLYNMWSNMKGRCYDVKDNQYHNYGGRGIRVYHEWYNNYISFRDYMLALPNCPVDAQKPGVHLRLIAQIDRYPDNDGNYEPGNVRWATSEEQRDNTRRIIHVTIGGKRMNLKEAVNKRSKIPYKTVLARYRNGWSLREAFFAPLNTKRKVTINVN